MEVPSLDPRAYCPTNLMKAQEPSLDSLEAASVEAEGSVVMPQDSTPVRSQESITELQSSPLSEALTFPSSPIYIKTEEDREGTDPIKMAAASASRSRARRPKGIDSLADLDMVAALKVPDINLNTPVVTSYRRVSQRVRTAVVPGSSATRKSQQKFPLTTKRRKRASNESSQVGKEEAKQESTNLESLGYRGAPLSDRPSHGHLTLSRPIIESVSAPKPTLESDHKQRGQKWEHTLSAGPNQKPTDSEPGIPVVDPKSMSSELSEVKESDAGGIEPMEARRSPATMDLDELKPLEPGCAVVAGGTMYDNVLTETRLRPRKPGPIIVKRKRLSTPAESENKKSGVSSISDSSPLSSPPRDMESISSSDNEDVVMASESYVEDEELPSTKISQDMGVYIPLNTGPDSRTSVNNHSASEGFKGSQQLLDDRDVCKKQKLNSSNASASTGKKAPAQGVPDPRVDKDAFQVLEGVLHIPRGCEYCLAARAFCDRGLPCGRCQRTGRSCSRRDGLVPARPKQQRITTKLEDSDTGDPVLARVRSGTLLPVENLRGDNPEVPLIQPKIERRGRPRKSEIRREIESDSEVKSEVREIKKEKAPLLSSIDFQKGKPAGIRRPEVWCETRQELCETLPYYRSYQAGCYGHDGLVHGYLLDGFSSPRDRIDSKVIISHSGGKSATDEDGHRRLLMDQTLDDTTIRYLMKNMKQKWPLVMIMGNQCEKSPSRVPHRYCVMDWFKVTAAWAERDPRSRYTRWKFRFEKLDSSVDGWWAAAPSEEPNPPHEMAKACCLACCQESPHIYEQGWACLNPICSEFWLLNGFDLPAELTYTENFLNCRIPWPEEFLQPPNSLAPPLDTELSVHIETGGVSRPFWKGMCCPKCGRLSCRELWAGWLCPTSNCGFSYNPPRTIFDATRLADPHRPIYTGPAIPSNICHEEITSSRFVSNGMTVLQYNLGDCGTVTHILANKESNSRPRDANWLLENYQNVDMPFKRFPMKAHHSQGRLLTQQFMYNCGAPYKFVVDVNSFSFEKSPPVVLRALELIHERVQLVHPDAEFNEVLNVGYFEKQKMDYHDDGEEGLGETVASISLGGSARMKFRVKSKHKNDRHCWTTEPEKPRGQGPGNAAFNDNDFEEENEEGDTGDATAGPRTDVSCVRAKGRPNKAMLDLCLNHGDVMVMKGAGIQAYWEHTVVPTGLFRVAATARYIAPNHPGRVSQEGDRENKQNNGQLVIRSTNSNPIKLEDPAIHLNDIKEIDNTNQFGSAGENNDFSAPTSPARQYGIGYVTSSTTAISQVIPSVAAVSSAPMGIHELDPYAKPGALHHPELDREMSGPTKSVPFSEMAFSGVSINGHHQPQSNQYAHNLGPPYTPIDIYPATQQSRLPLQELSGTQNIYYSQAPQYQPRSSYQLGTSYEPGPSSHPPNSHILPLPFVQQSPSSYCFENQAPYRRYLHSAVYDNSEKPDNLQNPFDTNPQSSNVSRNIFTGHAQGTNEFQNIAINNLAQIPPATSANLFENTNYNSDNDQTQNPAANSTDFFSTNNDRAHQT